MAAKSLIDNIRLVDRSQCMQEHTIARENVNTLSDLGS